MSRWPGRSSATIATASPTSRCCSTRPARCNAWSRRRGASRKSVAFLSSVTALDAYINSLYRSLKCLRNGNGLGARLEAADAIGHALTVIFALEGRHRPYYGYLARELEARPLATFPLPADELLAMLSTILESADAGTQQRLLGIIDALGRQAGCGDVFDEWEADYVWMQQYRPPDAST